MHVLRHGTMFKHLFQLESIYVISLVVSLLKRHLGAIVKLSPCDFVVIDSSRGNNLLQCKVRSCTIDLMSFNPSLRLRISGSFIHRAILLLIVSLSYCAVGKEQQTFRIFWLVGAVWKSDTINVHSIEARILNASKFKHNYMEIAYSWTIL